MPTRTQHSHRDHSPGVHVTAAAQRADDVLVTDDGFAGLAVKQSQPSPVTTLPANFQVIASGEKYFILDSGEVDVVIPAGLNPVKGDTLFITIADQTISKVAAAGKLKLGKVRYIGPERGLPSDMMTVGFDARKDF
jgi:hypothetical protein